VAEKLQGEIGAIEARTLRHASAVDFGTFAHAVLRCNRTERHRAAPSSA
jgi:hypothetical protein